MQHVAKFGNEAIVGVGEGHARDGLDHDGKGNGKVRRLVCGVPLGRLVKHIQLLVQGGELDNRKGALAPLVKGAHQVHVLGPVLNQAGNVAAPFQHIQGVRVVAVVVVQVAVAALASLVINKSRLQLCTPSS